MSQDKTAFDACGSPPGKLVDTQQQSFVRGIGQQFLRTERTMDDLSKVVGASLSVSKSTATASFVVLLVSFRPMCRPHSYSSSEMLSCLVSNNILRLL